MVYIRPLKTSDATVSYKWRNDPEVWQFTGSRPDQLITVETEHQWIEGVIGKSDERRFAICIKETEQYIGNIQLTNIKDSKAQYHVFIGEKCFWGKGLAKEATHLILKYAFDELKLDEVYLDVRLDNKNAFHLYKKVGFELTDMPSDAQGFTKMSITNKNFADH